MSKNRFFKVEECEQDLVQDLIIESLDIYALEFFYVPRTLVAKDEILGEDRLSKFENYYPVDCYMESIDGFEGQGAFVQKFGYQLEQSCTLVIARKSWAEIVGEDEKTILPNRPCEGDLLYFPLTKGLFEIKYVEHQNPFYQLNKLYTYKLSVELFKYSSEVIETGMEEIDIFETLKTFDIEQAPDIDIPDSYGDNNKIKEESKDIIVGDGFKI